MDSEDNNIDLNILDIFNFIALIINKNKKLFSILLVIGFLGTSIFNATKKPLWRGKTKVSIMEFEDNKISLNPNEESQQEKSIDILNNEIKNKFEILQTRVVLQPIYDLYVSNSVSNKKNKIKDYGQWKNHLNLNLIRGTNLLEITYSTKDKSSIKPLLTKLVDLAQSYSRNKKLKTAKETLNKLQVEFPILEKEALDTAKRLDIFLIKKNLDNYPDLLREYNFEKKLVFINKDKLPNKNKEERKEILPISEKRNSTKLKDFDTTDLVNFRSLEAKFEIAQENYINSLINKSNIKNKIIELSLINKFNDTIQIDKISEYKSKYYIKSFIFLLLLIFTICWLIEKKKGTIFFTNAIEKFFNEKPLLSLSKNNRENWDLFLDIIFNNFKNEGELTILNVGYIPEDFLKQLNSSSIKISVINFEDSFDYKKLEKAIIITSLGYIKVRDLENISALSNLLKIPKINYLIFKHF